LVNKRLLFETVLSPSNKKTLAVIIGKEEEKKKVNRQLSELAFSFFPKPLLNHVVAGLDRKKIIDRV